MNQPPKRGNLTEVLPEELVIGRSYLIESTDVWVEVYRCKGTFLENSIIDDKRDPPLIQSRFRIEKYPQNLTELLGYVPDTEGFRNYLTRYYLATADEIILAKVIEANTNLDVGPTIAKGFYREPKRPKKGDTKTKGTKGYTKTKRTTPAKKGGTKEKTKRTT